MAQKAQEAALLKSMAEGEYSRSVAYSENVQLTSGTEQLLAVWGSADHKIILVYATIAVDYQNEVAEYIPCEWFLVKTADVNIPNMSDSAVFENLMREKKIFARGYFILCNTAYGYPMQKIRAKVFNVALEEDEYLQLIVLPYATSAAASGLHFVRKEARTLVLD